MRHVGWIREALLIGAVFAVDVLISVGAATTTRGGLPLPPFVVTAVAAVASVALAWRWRHPVAVFAGEWIYSMTAVVVPGWQPLAAVLVALYTAARTATARMALVYLSATLVPFGVDSVNTWENSANRTVALLLGPFVLYTVLTLTVWGFARLALTAEHNAETTTRRETEAALRSERLALARELHDIVANSVSAMIMQAAGATTLVGDRDPRVAEALNQIEKSGVQAMTELQRLLGLLRSVGDEATDAAHAYNAAPDIDDVDELVLAARGAGLDVRVHQSGDRVPLDESVSLTAYRVVQESLTNAMRYAGRGALAELTLLWTPSRLFLTVRDENGTLAGRPGAGVAGSGYGLVGLTERVKLVGGHLGYGPTMEGFLVQAELPIDTEPSDPEKQEPAFGAEDGT